MFVFLFFLELDNDDLLLLDYDLPTADSVFHVDPFGVDMQHCRETKSSSTMFYANDNNNFFAQIQPQLIPNRVLTPTPAVAISQSPLTLKDLNLNSNNKKNDIITDLLDFDNPGPLSANREFDPYA